jgi:hypothetical protein
LIYGLAHASAFTYHLEIGLRTQQTDQTFTEENMIVNDKDTHAFS